MKKLFLIMLVFAFIGCNEKNPSEPKTPVELAFQGKWKIRNTDDTVTVKDSETGLYWNDVFVKGYYIADNWFLGERNINNIKLMYDLKVYSDTLVAHIDTIGNTAVYPPIVGFKLK